LRVLDHTWRHGVTAMHGEDCPPAAHRPVTAVEPPMLRGSTRWLRRAIVASTALLLAVVCAGAVVGLFGEQALGSRGQAGAPVWLLSDLDETTGLEQSFQTKVNAQVQHLEHSEEKDEARASTEGVKGEKLSTQAARECKIAEHLQDTDTGLQQRARKQREAALSLKGRAAELIAEADKEHAAYLELAGKGAQLKENGQLLLSKGTTLLSHKAQTNATTALHAGARKAQPLAAANGTSSMKLEREEGHESEDQGGLLIAAAAKVNGRGEAHQRNEERLRAQAAQATAASKAVLELGERFERRAVSHRLKTLTARSKCTMIRAKAESALSKAEDEAEAAQELKRAVAAKPARAAAKPVGQ